MKTWFYKSFVFAILVMMLSSIPGWAADLQNYTVVSENEYLNLFINEATTEIAVQEKSSGHVWYSSPQDLRQETIKRGRARDGLRALFTLNYYTPQREARTLNSYTDSVQNEEFTVSFIPDGVRIDYTLGKQWADESYYPIMIAKDKFEALLEKVEDEDDREILQENYTLLNLVERDEDPYAKVLVYGVDFPQVFGDWELIALSGSVLDRYAGAHDTPEEKTKELVEFYTDTIVKYRNDIDRRGLITAKDITCLRNNPMYGLLEGTYPTFDKPEIYRIFNELGYTPQDVIADHTMANLDPPIPNPEVFIVPVIVKLDGSNLVVSIPVQEIKYPIDVLTKEGDLATYLPYSLDLLQHFGAAGTSAEGYIFVPDRSGALIKLNDRKKLGFPSFYASVYGVDRSITPQLEKISDGAQIRLPVYGLKDGDSAFFAIIEDGQALAYLTAELAGKTDSFNKVSSGYVLTPRTTITLYGVDTTRDDRMIDAYSARPYQGNITLRIGFLTGDQASYAGMANYYRSYLVEKHQLQRVTPEEELPFYLELIGGIHDRAVILGASREVIHPMTSYTQVEEIIQELREYGIDNLRVRYTGWSRGGIEHRFPDKVQLEESLGDSADFTRLLQYVDEEGIDLYLDVAFMTVYKDSLFDGFRVGRDAARFLNRAAAKIYEFNLSNFQQIQSKYRYILSPRRLDSLVDSFLKDIRRYDVKGICLRQMGDVVYSDFVDRVATMVDRQQALRITQAQMRKFTDTGYKLMIHGGNDSAFPYASHIISAPTEGSRLQIVDRSVPFYQMAIHGYIECSGMPFNIRQAPQDRILRCIETGEIPYYRWSYADSSAVKDTDFDHLRALNYRHWIAEAAEICGILNPLLNNLRTQAIVNHEMLIEGVYRTTYDSGTVVVVNYNEEAYTGDAVMVKGKDYIISQRSEAN